MRQSRSCRVLLTIALLIPLLVFIIPASGAGSETLITANTSADQAKPTIHGIYIAWVDSRNGISQDIYLYNTATLQEYRITNGSAIVDAPDIQGNRVVWAQGGRDICWYDIPTGRVHQVPLDNSPRYTPKISGDRIVWTEQRTFTAGPHNDIMMYDIGMNMTFNLTGGQPDTDQEKPAISGTIVVWEDHRRLSGNYDIYGIDTSGGDPAAWIEKPVCTETGDKTSPAIHGDIVVWQDARTSYSSPHVHSAYFSTTTDFWNSSRNDSYFDQQFSPSVYGDTFVWVDTWPDLGTYIGMYNSTTLETKEPLTSPLTNIPSTDCRPSIYQNRVVWQDVRSGLSQIYLYTEGVSLTCPVADFRQDNTTIRPGEAVHFFDTSTPVPDTWFWEFGDGTNSTEQNPVHRYTIPGTYAVMLSVGSVSCRSTTTFGSHQVSVAAVPEIDFFAAPTTGMAPLTVVFNGSATGNPTSWVWDFGDGTTDIAQNTTHTYDQGGVYTVILNATNGIGTGTKSKTGYIHVLTGAHEVAYTTIPGITIDNHPGYQFLIYEKSVLPNFFLSGSVLTSHPPAAYGWKNITFIALENPGFQTRGTNITGSISGVIFQTNDIRPTGFSSSLGSPLSLSYQKSLSSYPVHASIVTEVWENTSEDDFLTYQNIIHQNGFSTLSALAYTVNVTETNFGTTGSRIINLSVGTDWVAGFEGITKGRSSTSVIATGHDSAGNYYGMVLQATFLFNNSSHNIDYFSVEVPARYWFLSKFSLAKLSGSGNFFQLITLTITGHGESGRGGGDTPIVVQNTVSPVRVSPSLADPGKTAKIYSNVQGVITQATTLTSTDGYVTVSIDRGIVGKDSSGKPLSWVSITRIPVENVTVSPGTTRSSAGMFYEIQPDGAVFSPSILVSFTILQATWGQEYAIQEYDNATGTWLVLPNSYDPQTGIITAQISHFCCFGLFSKSREIETAEIPKPTTTILVASKSSMSTNVGMYSWIISSVSQNPSIIVIVVTVLALVAYLRWWKRRL